MFLNEPLLRNNSRVNYFMLVFLSGAILFSCKGRKDVTLYSWKNKEESRTLTLLNDSVFVFDVNAGYYKRIDTGSFAISGDTIILNPQKVYHDLDSVVTLDSLFNGSRFLEVYEEEIMLNGDEITESFHRPSIFPTVVVNDSIPLSLFKEDVSFRKLLIPDQLTLSDVVVTRREENTCKPFLKVPIHVLNDKQGKSYRVYLRSRQRKENYLAGYKWLIKGRTVQLFFENENCDPNEIKLTRK